MATVKCQMDDCINHDAATETCKADEIEINGMYECDTYTNDAEDNSDDED